ncbi:MAG: hypothetical protein SFX73_36255 [Kofleriaceae bacterium]|nr:hypothetical protein [Kofleriaceae bacterium]
MSKSVTLIVVLAIAGCGDDAGGPLDAGGDPPLDGPSVVVDPDKVYDSDLVDGHYPPPDPSKLIIIDGPNVGPGLSLTDIQASHPGIVDADRLYIRAGHYAWIEIRNLPERSAERPLVITNLGGQVRVGGIANGNSITIKGGSNWAFTGRYDPIAKTGDPAFPGHKYGYENSAGKYGIFVDDEWVHANNSCGMYVGNYPPATELATDFELEFLELTRNSYCGLSVKNDERPTGTMANVRIHDIYSHDNHGECLYLGSTQNPENQHVFTNLRVYNNRFLRCDYETAQFGQLDEGSQIHHNVFAFGALKRLDQFTQGQDNNVQISVRNGAVSFHHNVVIGAGFASAIVFRNKSLRERGDERVDLVLHDNYFEGSLCLGNYFGAAASTALQQMFPADAASVAPSKVRIENNYYRGITWGYNRIAPAQQTPALPEIMSSDAIKMPIHATGNRWEGNGTLYPGLAVGVGTGTSTSKGTQFNATDNERTTVEPYRFVDLAFPGTELAKLERWLPQRGGGAVADYPADFFVQHQSKFYRSLVANDSKVPPENPATWQEVAGMHDDVRQAVDSPYYAKGIGLLDDAGNMPPVVSAGDDIAATWADGAGEITATVSDPDDAIVSIVWERISGPAEVVLAQIRSARLKLSEAPAGTYVFRITATDSQGASSFDEMQLVVKR